MSQLQNCSFCSVLPVCSGYVVRGRINEAPWCIMGRRRRDPWCNAILCWDTLAPVIHAAVTSSRTTYLRILTARLVQHDKAPCLKRQNGSGDGLRCLLTSKLLSSHPIEHLWDCAGQTSPREGLKGSAANALVPDTNAHFQSSRGVRDETGERLLWQQLKAYLRQLLNFCRLFSY